MADLVVIGNPDGTTDLIEAAAGTLAAMQAVRPAHAEPFADIGD